MTGVARERRRTSAPGRSLVSPPSDTSTHALRVDVRGVAAGPPPRPRVDLRVQPAEALRPRCRTSRTSVFQLSTWGSVAASCRGPRVPTISGTVRAGRRQQHGVVDLPDRPSLVTRSPASILRTISKLLDEARTRGGRTGSPKARNSVSFQPDADAEHEAPAADLVDRRRHAARPCPGGWNARHATSGPSDHALGDGRERGQQRPGVPAARARAALVAVEQVVAEPDRVESRPPRPHAPSRDTPASARRARPPGAGLRRAGDGSSGHSRRSRGKETPPARWTAPAACCLHVPTSRSRRAGCAGWPGRGRWGRTARGSPAGGRGSSRCRRTRCRPGARRS